MSTVVVLGAGPLGAAVAHRLTYDDAVQRVVIVDASTPVAQGLALDIRQAAAVTGGRAGTEATSDIGAVVGASVVVVADRHLAGEWRGDDGLAHLAAVRALNRHALFVCAGASQADLVDGLVRHRGLDPRLLVGSAPDASRSAAMALVALEAGAGARDVSLAVIGRPPDALFPAWDGASIAGSRAVDVLAPPVVARVERQLAALAPPGPLTLAAAAAGVVRRRVRGTTSWSCLYLVPANRDSGHRGVALPASLDADGAQPEWPMLSPRDRTRLESCSLD